jgi:integrase
MRRHDWKNWTNRVFLPAARAAGAKISRAYDLRHSFCLLPIAEGPLSIAEIAEQMGHSMLMTLDNVRPRDRRGLRCDEGDSNR